MYTFFIAVTKWNELSALDIDLSLFRPVYAPKDFLEILTQVTSFNYDDKIISQIWEKVVLVPSLTRTRSEPDQIFKLECVENSKFIKS